MGTVSFASRVWGWFSYVGLSCMCSDLDVLNLRVVGCSGSHA